MRGGGHNKFHTTILKMPVKTFFSREFFSFIRGIVDLQFAEAERMNRFESDRLHLRISRRPRSVSGACESRPLLRVHLSPLSRYLLLLPRVAVRDGLLDDGE